MQAHRAATLALLGACLQHPRLGEAASSWLCPFVMFSPSVLLPPSCAFEPHPPRSLPPLQAFDSMNKALKLSCTKGLPVRVVRSFKARPLIHTPRATLACCNLPLPPPHIAKAPMALHQPCFTHLASLACPPRLPTCLPNLCCSPPGPCAGEAVCLRPHPGHPRALRRHLPHRQVLAHQGQAGVLRRRPHAQRGAAAGQAGAQARQHAGRDWGPAGRERALGQGSTARPVSTSAAPRRAS